MTKSIVNVFEIVQINIKKRALTVDRLRLGNITPEILLAAHTVIETCQEIIVCLILNLLLVQFLIRDVVKSAKSDSASVHPVNLRLVDIQPALLLYIIDLIIIMCLLLFLFTKYKFFQISRCDRMREEILQLLVRI